MAFKSLVTAVSEQCQEIKQTLSSIPYFDTWDGDVIAECCRLSSLAEFPPKQIILGSGTGNSHTVYFILDGVCRMIQYLQVETRGDSRGGTRFNLYKPGTETVSSESGSVGYVSLLFNDKHDFQKRKIVDEKKPKPEEYDEDHHVRVLAESRQKLRDIIHTNEEDASLEKPENVNGYFIQTGYLFKGACFGLKKYTDKNFIMSETRVKCLKIPRGFLFQNNPCNVWKRILLFDSLYQPKEEEILACFQTDRKWAEGKRKLTESIVGKRKLANYTGVFDVPYSVRLTNPLLTKSGRGRETKPDPDSSSSSNSSNNSRSGRL